MDYRDYNIDIRTSKTTGEITCLCPQCSHTRKKKKDKCLSVNLDKQAWVCHHCGWKGAIPKSIKKEVYVKPEWKNNTQLSEKLVKWFEARGIQQKTLSHFKISEGKEWMPQTQKEENTVQFNYFRNEELVNVKYRDGNKNFKLHKGSELVMYNLDAIKESDVAIITEGEVDCMSFWQAGYKNVISVPNGATLQNNNLQYLDNCIDDLEHINTFYLALDNDIAGRKLRSEIAERLGIDKCKYVEFDEYKDCNDLLIHKGIIGVSEAINNAKDFPIEGVFTLSDLDNDINDMYVNGLDNGVRTGMYNFDEYLRFVKGYITTVTGIPGHGKSDFVDQIAVKLNLKEGWKFAFYSPENKPTRLHISKLARKIVGKKWFGEDRITLDELEQVKQKLEGNFWFIKPEKDFTIDTILNSVKYLKKTKGIDAFVIDAWNKLEHKYGQSETKYIGETLDKLAIFCEENNVHLFLVAHPTKIMKDKATGSYEIPNLYNISGSANFYNKTDNGITVYRDFKKECTDVYVQKVKFNHWGKVGFTTFYYHLDSGRFCEDLSIPQFNWIEHKRKEPKEVADYTLPKPTLAEAFGIEDYQPNGEIPF